MKLYNYDSPSPRRVRIFLAEKGLKAELIHVDLFKGEHLDPAFVARNPFHAVPVLETDDGQVIAESHAICRYLEAIQPRPALFGTTPIETAHVDMWMQRIEQKLLAPLGAIWVHGSPITASPKRRQIPEAAEAGRREAARVFRILDEALGRTAYLAGDRFSAADIMALCTVDFGVRRELATYGPEHANLKRWHDLVSARPSARA